MSPLIVLNGAVFPSSKRSYISAMINRKPFSMTFTTNLWAHPPNRPCCIDSSRC
jgi:hypothetical protein